MGPRKVLHGGGVGLLFCAPESPVGLSGKGEPPEPPTRNLTLH